MFHIKSKKITFSLAISVLLTISYPALTQAEPYGTGDIAAGKAAEQRAAIEKRKERIKKEKEAEAKKTTEGQPTTTQQPAQSQAEKPAAQ
jgi:hypothetical protein